MGSIRVWSVSTVEEFIRIWSHSVLIEEGIELAEKISRIEEVRD